MRILLLWSVAWALTGCTGSTTYVEGADPCARPVSLPAGYLNDRQVELLWSRDRKALLDCGDKVEVLSGREVNSDPE
ncbi:hypothetical protein [Roseobacter sp. AzwK-3b]|uniref:hypothetical protein n=1 Tax=Roseobacter sp. AzwK-3b TaxID=351016 RepID=UPI0018DB1193|nr:hypothetical protein [Roseobacter sp. AzwK-3b]